MGTRQPESGIPRIHPWGGFKNLCVGAHRTSDVRVRASEVTRLLQVIESERPGVLDAYLRLRREEQAKTKKAKS